VSGTSPVELKAEQRSAPYIFPFLLFLVVLASLSRLPLDLSWSGPIWFVIFVPVCAVCWPRDLSVRPRRWWSSIGIGIAAFAIWITPDLLFPVYRESILFSNAIVGHPKSSMPSGMLHGSWVLAWRAARATLIVPVVEELFWRVWLMRWLIDHDLGKVPLGAYTPLAFWLTAILFASEHGPYWDVGLLVGIVYNLWMIRTKSVADCILMHAATNGVLSTYVIATGQWQYWQ